VVVEEADLSRPHQLGRRLGQAARPDHGLELLNPLGGAEVLEEAPLADGQLTGFRDGTVHTRAQRLDLLGRQQPAQSDRPVAAEGFDVGRGEHGGEASRPASPPGGGDSSDH
jgi:hypothetical protein